MSTLVEIEEAIDRLPDLDVDQLAEWLERRRARKSSRHVSAPEPQFLERARQIWGDRPAGVALSELVSRSRAWFMVYLDTGCLVKLYYPEEDSEVVESATAWLPFVLTPLHNLELTSAMRLKVFRQEATEDQVLVTLRSVSEDLAAGKLIAIDNVNSTTIHVAVGLANQHSSRTGGRPLDTLHYALAQSLEISAFLSTDARQLAMAILIRLPVIDL